MFASDIQEHLQMRLLPKRRSDFQNGRTVNWYHKCSYVWNSLLKLKLNMIIMIKSISCLPIELHFFYFTVSKSWNELCKILPAKVTTIYASDVQMASVLPYVSSFSLPLDASVFGCSFNAFGLLSLDHLIKPLIFQHSPLLIHVIFNRLTKDKKVLAFGFLI